MNPSPERRRAQRHLAILPTCGSLVVLFVWFRTGTPPVPPASEDADTMPAQATAPARNPIDLVLLTDPAQVVGWISGDRDHEGETVRAIDPAERR